TQYASEWMKVESYTRGGTKFTMDFKNGNPASELITEQCPKNRTGTVVSWKPDLDVFSDIAIGLEYFESTLEKQAVVNAGRTINLKFQKEDLSYYERSFVYPDGIVEYVKQRTGETALMPVTFFNGEREGRDRPDKPDYKLKMELAFTFTNDSPFIEFYHNSSFLEHGGSPDKATKSAFPSAIDDWLRNNGKYTKNESKVIFADVEDSLAFVSSSFSGITSYANQTKKAITNVFIAKAMTEFFKHCLEVYFAENPSDAERVCMQVLINKRSRESAENMRMNTKKKLTTSLDISNSVEKFVNCRSKDPLRRELYIVEGDSALTSVKLARSAEFQAIIPVRGKTFNCLKSSYERILKNEIIMDLIKVIGCGVEIKSKAAKNLAYFDINNMRWSKIIICTDADVDGFHIRTLILTMFYRLLPSLIKEGRVFIAETPLYEITSKDKTYFAYDEKEKSN
ncbi:MAG TPA: toprim domain-containing protein, partial [Bacillota bacterium]|nr:toprim domain-containing protein [Bacillota bacterium]